MAATAVMLGLAAVALWSSQHWRCPLFSKLLLAFVPSELLLTTRAALPLELSERNVDDASDPCKGPTQEVAVRPGLADHF